MEEFSIESCVRGHHVYKNIWDVSVGEELPCKTESGNEKDPYAVAVMRRHTVVGHLPRKISAACSLFLRRKGTIRCTVTGTRRYSADLPQGGLEVPCILKFRGEPKDVAKVTKLLRVSTEVLNPKENQQPNKKRRLGPDVVDVEHVVIKSNAPKPWLSLSHIDLTETDRDTITAGGQLSDSHINFAQAILRRQFDKVLGLQSTLLQSRLRAPLPATGALQILHSRGNHWIVASTVGCSAGEVMVFDSLYSSIDQATRDLILQVFGKEVHIKLEKSPQQLGGKDCGVFAVAICTALANGIHSGSISFDQKAMRLHLVKCFEQFCLTPFPSK